MEKNCQIESVLTTKELSNLSDSASLEAIEVASVAGRKEEVASSEVLPPVVLSVKNVQKSFKLPTEKASGLKQAFVNRLRGIKGYRRQQVLKDVSFEVRQGDFFGIVGRNGSGKSTLLKLISQIYYPDSGTINVSGRLVPFIELGVGFNPELTGRENVYLNGALLGFTRPEIDAMYDDIVEFAELHDFMDQKLKNYSSGMQVRLAFSVAIKAQGDILVLDEVLAVGDESFQRKCDDYFRMIKQDRSKTVILVTHSMDAVKRYCNKAILIKNGLVAVNGDKNQVADEYTLANLEAKPDPDSLADGSALAPGEYPPGLSETVPMLKIWTEGNPVAQKGEPFKFYIDYEYNGDKTYAIPFNVFDLRRGGIIYDSGFDLILTETGKRRLEVVFPTEGINNTELRLYATLRTVLDKDDPSSVDVLAFTNPANILEFAIRHPERPEYNDYGLLSSQMVGLTMQVKPRQ